MKVLLSNLSGVPIYEQIKEQVRAAILGGELGDGELLPSLRQLAKDLRISVLTATRAYTDLEQEGYVKNIQGKGCYVLPRGNELIREQLLRDVEAGLSVAIRSARLASLSDGELCHMLELLLEVENNG